jgi:hypothetical protein
MVEIVVAIGFICVVGLFFCLDSRLVRLRKEVREKNGLVNDDFFKIVKKIESIQELNNLRLEVAELKGELKMVGKAPVLRQYVEKYVAPEAVDEKEVQKKMQEMEAQFERLYGYKTDQKQNVSEFV